MNATGFLGFVIGIVLVASIILSIVGNAAITIGNILQGVAK